eukprot:TRINITY_DN23282_c0_g1_i1.p1 TRINITY_DN23282_c0_g1~~TRINITY_DN23282_c0_g1_i1.p1  ORF type:complete len:156 (+),score=3.51 TRINITY_DN23282_c0_g1_i1:33-470(+)
MQALATPFHFLRLPNLNLRLPSLQKPSPMLVFSFVFLSYFLVLSGIIYDIIVEPPSIGSSNENGAVRPVAFLRYRVNGQYIIEGLASGFMFAVGALGFILLDRSNNKGLLPNTRTIQIVAGLVCIILAYNLCVLFLRIKIPGYLH